MDNYDAKKVALVYPSEPQTDDIEVGLYEIRKNPNKKCSIISLTVQTDVDAWQQQIGTTIKK
jgi:hypothetical protein